MTARRRATRARQTSPGGGRLARTPCGRRGLTTIECALILALIVAGGAMAYQSIGETTSAAACAGGDTVAVAAAGTPTLVAMIEEGDGQDGDMSSSTDQIRHRRRIRDGAWYRRLIEAWQRWSQ